MEDIQPDSSVDRAVRFERTSVAGSTPAQVTKTCSKCNLEKKESDFFLKRNKPMSHCIECQRRYIRDHYNKNKQYYIEKAHRYGAKLKLRNKNFVCEYLMNHPCVDCGESDIVVLEFDHINDDKLHNISTLIMAESSLDKIKAEITKCEVVCCNCHRKRTANRGQWYRIIWQQTDPYTGHTDEMAFKDKRSLTTAS